MVPITGIRSAEPGIVHVRNGQRRTLAAREAGLATVPVYVLPSPVDARPGDHRTDRAPDRHQRPKQNLTDAQRARGIQQMIDAGLTVTKVAKRCRWPRTRSRPQKPLRNPPQRWTPSTVGSSVSPRPPHLPNSRTAGALERLAAAAGGRRFDHVVAQLRDERASMEGQATAEAGYTEQGFTVLDEHPTAGIRPSSRCGT